MCGICGIWSPREQASADPAEAARLMFFSLYALQHRGQESAGLAATDGRDLRVVRRMGLVGQVFSEPDLSVLEGRAAMGHTRYSTTGASKIQNAQPLVVRDEELGELAIAHNGNCINAREVRRIDDRGPVTIADLASADRRGLCIFEHVYLASAASRLGGVSVYATRERMGEILAEEQPAIADAVIPVPDSAIPAAVGYARRSGLPFHEGLIKNRYIGRTFIQPSAELRRHNVALKYNARGDVLEGKRIVVVDDSIVRGTTSGPIVDLLRRHGAREVHMRICSPPIRHACFFGVDMARRDDLIASRLDVDEIRRHIGADSLGYLSLDGMVRATGGTADEYCAACFTGHYLLPVQPDLDKGVLERTDASERVKSGA